MDDTNYTIRPMTRDEVDLTIEWAATEGWNPGLHDAASYYRTDPDGFLVGLLGDEPIATISAIRYGESFGFLGFYMVKPAHRGKGYGIRIWDAGLGHLAGRNIGLDGVVAQQDNYRKSGFKLAYRNVRYEGIGGGSPAADVETVALSSLPFEAIRDYERPFFPEDRSLFLQAWISQPGCRALGVVRNGHLAGYGVIRPCRNGYKIGPLLADTPDLAESLLLALKSEARASDAVFLDVPEINPTATALATRHGMTVSFETARMYTGAFPSLPFDRLFGVTSFEVG